MYEKEIDKIVKLCGLEDFDSEILEEVKKKMEADLKIGVENGHSVEDQIRLCEALSVGELRTLLGIKCVVV